MHFTSSLAAVALFALAPSVTANPVNLAKRQPTVKVMPLGDSITGYPGCWRAYLWKALQAANMKNIDFVGTLTGSTCDTTFDENNEGHSGFEAINIVKNNQLPGWLSATTPDIVMMHLGTNDIWHNSSSSTPDIIAALDTLVDQMRASKPNMIILVAKILPMNPPSGCPNCLARSQELGDAIGDWAPGKSSWKSSVTVVDAFTGFNTTTMTTDGVHPNDLGNKQLAATWFQPVKNAAMLEPIMTWVCSMVQC